MPSDEIKEKLLRIPKPVLDSVEEEARIERRSVNQQIVRALEERYGLVPQSEDENNYQEVNV